MSRIRTIKPEFPQSETTGRLSRDARLLFIQLWTVVDDAGRTRAASRMLASLLYPYDDDAPKLIDKWLNELEAQNCIRRYVVDGCTYLEIINWLKHQKIDRPSASKIPAFVEGSTNPREESRILDADLVPVSGPVPGKDHVRTGAVAPSIDAFEEFRKVYPKREGADPNPPARKLFVAALKAGTEAAEIIAGAKAFAAQEAKNVGTPYIPQAQKWLRRRGWEDYAAQAKTATGPPKPPAEGLPTHDELKAKYERNATTSESVLGSSESVHPSGQLGRDHTRESGAQRVGEIFSASGLDAVGTEDDGNGQFTDDYPTDAMARMVR